MKIEKRDILFQDPRGWIADITVNEPFDHATIIFSKKGSRRGDHYHAESVQTVYLIAGVIKVLAQVPGCNVEEAVLEHGHLLTNEAFECHAFIALEDSVFLVLTRGPRGGNKYEDDTFRVEPLEMSP